MVLPPLPRGQNLPERRWEFPGFQVGVDTFSLPTELKPNALAQLTNGELYGKRSLRPRRGGTRLGASLGGSAVDGLFQFKEGSVNEILGISGGTLKKYNSATEIWNAVTGGTFTSGLRTRGVKTGGYHYLGNGVDDFARYNGTQVETFTAVAAPTGLAVSAQGTTGTTSYEYTITTVTNKGQSLPVTNVAITNGNIELSATNFNRVTFNRRTESQVIGYNLFGRSTRGLGVTLLKYIEQPASGATVTFDDTGVLSPQLWLPPEGDSTDGPRLSMWEQLRGSIVGAGLDEPDRLFYSGTGSNKESFSPAHNGGWADARPGDNDAGINGLAPFESKVIVAKENSIHQFYFSATTGDAIMQELITYTGCGAPGSMVVMENDVAFLDRELKLRILGYEPNFSASIRTTSLSEGRVQSLFDNIDPNYIQNCEAVYHKGRYYLACTSRGSTVNDMIIPYDRKYLAFLGTHTGTNAHVRCWLVYDGVDRKRRLFAGSSDSGYVFEYDVEGVLTDHDGSAVLPVIRTRNEDLKNSGQEKIWKWGDFRIYRIQGTLQIKTILNGATTLDEKSFSSVTNTGWGVKRWGSTKWGTPTGTAASASDLDKTYRKEIFEPANSLCFEISKTGAQDDFILVSMMGEAFLLPTDVFNSANVI